MALFAILEIAAATTSLVYYLGCCLRDSLRTNTHGTEWRYSTRAADQKNAAKSRPRASWFQMAGTMALLTLSLAHAYLLAEVKSQEQWQQLESRSDIDVSCVLFASLLWLILFLGIVDSSDVAGSEHYVPWCLSLISYGVSAGLFTARKSDAPEARDDAIVQWTRLGLLAILLLSAVFFRPRKPDATEQAKSEETQPLLSENSADDPKNDNDADSIISITSAASDIARDEKEDSQRLALRDRTWWQYLYSFRIFIPFIRPRTRRQYVYLAITCVNTLAARVVTLALPLTLGSLINDLGKHKFSWPKILAYVGLRFAGSASGIHLIRSIVSYRLNTEMNMALTRHCFNHIMDLSADFHLNKSTPSTWQIMDRGNSVVTLLQDIFFSIIPVIVDLITALFIVAKLFGAYLCFAVATTMILLSWSNRVTMTRKTDMRRNFITIWNDWYTHMSESFMHWKTVSEFNKVGHEKERHANKSIRATEIQISNRYFRMWLDALQEVVVTVGFMVVCILVAKQIVDGRADVGGFVTLITYWGLIMDPVTTLAGSASDISEQLVDAEKLMLILEKEPSIKETPNAKPLSYQGGAVTFEDVCFSYDGERVVTDNVSFTALPGETVALVGETGGGKSTIFNLLYRFFDPSSGRVLVDGQDIKDVQLESFRDTLGLVPQNPILFNASIMKNVKYSNLKASDEDVKNACKAAQLDDKIMKFPKGYQQRVGEMAQKLSGGELQRLAIARAILKDPKILLLDEATSAVDSVTESKIQGALGKLCKGRTVFVIAHRLSTIMGADRILVIKGGKVVESGRHEELLKHKDGAYRELWSAQAKLARGMREKEEKKKAKKAAKEDGSDDEEEGDGGDALVFFDDLGGVLDLDDKDAEDVQKAQSAPQDETSAEAKLEVQEPASSEDKTRESSKPEAGSSSSSTLNDAGSKDGKGGGYNTFN